MLIKHAIFRLTVLASGLLIILAAAISTATAQTAVDKSKVLASNEKFYETFRNGDFKGMSEVWSPQENAVGMIPPGLEFLKGREKVLGHFRVLLTRKWEIKCDLEDVSFQNQKAVVICNEVLNSGAVRMMNVFGPSGDDDEKQWKMLYHGPVPEDWGKT